MTSNLSGGISRQTVTRSANVIALLLSAAALAACGGGDDGTSPFTASGSGDTGAQSQPPSPPALGSGAPQSASVTCKDYKYQPMTVTPKTVTVYNDSDGVIYPVLATSKNPVNEWMQACERSSDDFATNSVFKLYVNEGKGIPPDSSVTLTLPLYSELDDGTYITWWNGGRVVLANDTHRLRTTGDISSEKPDVSTPVPQAVSCQAQGTSCALTLYSSDVQFPTDVYAQLTEYTFGDSVFPAGQDRRLLMPENVGYNISYVDHVYLPVAMEPAGNPYIGYSGSTVDLKTFSSAIDAFLNGPDSPGAGWPVYNMTKRKLPGGYNVFAERGGVLPLDDDAPVKPSAPQPPSNTVPNPPVLTVMQCLNGGCDELQKSTLHYGQAVQRMKNLWSTCVQWAPGENAPASTDPTLSCPADLAQTMQLVHDFFKANHQKYLALVDQHACDLRPKPDGILTFNYDEALQHIYGWVPFNEGCDAAANKLSETAFTGTDGKTWTNAQVQPLYTEQLQYNYRSAEVQKDPRLLFNPYVPLIHEDMKMNAYGFSVDDAVGFMSELGSGIILTVGGDRGLPNPGQFSYAGGFSVNLGVPSSLPANQPLLKSYGVCTLDANNPSKCETVTQDVQIPQLNQIVGFRVGTVASYPIRIAFTDEEDNLYTFDVAQAFSCSIGKTPRTCTPAINQIVSHCSIKDKQGRAYSPSEQARWCAPDPNSQQDPASKDPQTVKNVLGFPMPINYLLQQ